MSSQDNEPMCDAELLREQFPMQPSEPDPRSTFYQMGYAARVAEEARNELAPRSIGSFRTTVSASLLAAVFAFMLGLIAKPSPRDQAMVAGTIEHAKADQVRPSETTMTPVIDSKSSPADSESPDDATDSSGVPSIDFVWNAAPRSFTLTASGMRLEESSAPTSIGSVWRTSEVLSEIETEI
ncbi:MAG: hypothetical protein AAFX06_21465 [Planctomycetota bacterium]